MLHFDVTNVVRRIIVKVIFFGNSFFSGMNQFVSKSERWNKSADMFKTSLLKVKFQQF